MVNGEDGIAPWGPVRTCGKKTARVDEQYPGTEMTDCLVAVAVNDAVGLGKQIPDPFFDIMAGTVGSVTKADGFVSQGDEFAGWQGLLAFIRAHIAMHGMDLTCTRVAQGLQDGNIAQVSCVDNHTAFVKGLCDLLMKQIIVLIKMGIGEKTDANH